MASPKSTINPIQSISFYTSESAINQWAACYQGTSADMTAVLPASAATTEKFLGFARYGLTTGATSIELITAGVAIAVAGAAITAGDNIESSATNGRVQTRTTGTIIGRALDSAGAAGDLIRVEIVKPS